MRLDLLPSAVIYFSSATSKCSAVVRNAARIQQNAETPYRKATNMLGHACMHSEALIGRYVNFLIKNAGKGIFSTQLLVFLSALVTQGQSYMDSATPQYMAAQDKFQVELCRERWSRIDWEYILRPCQGVTSFGVHMLPKNWATNAILSKIVNMDIQKAGEYNKLTIQTVNDFGIRKTVGGDTWRVLITGPSSIQPIVHDMGNGEYEVPFLLIEPGLYKADVFMEGTLCNQYVDPPPDWFKKGTLDYLYCKEKKLHQAIHA